MAAGTIGGAVLSGSAQSHAANTAAQAETNAANANIAQANQFRQQNQANFQPNINSGFQANALLDSFLTGNNTDWNAYLQQNPDVLQNYQQNLRDPSFAAQFPTAAQYAQYHYQRFGQSEGRQLPQSSSNAAFDQFTKTPFYQFPLQEGMRQLNTSLASRGELKSGDAMKAAIQYGQNYASNQFNNFLGLAENQANRGIQGAGAVAGVGVNALNSITNSNNAAGQAAANAALASGAANANMYAGIGSALGQFAGTAINPSMSPFASSYGSGGINVNTAATNNALARLGY